MQAESAEVAVGLELELHVECSTEHIITSRDVSRITEVEGGAAPCTFSDHGVVPHSSLDGGFVCFYGSRTWNTRRSVDLDLLTHVPVVVAWVERAGWTSMKDRNEKCLEWLEVWTVRLTCTVRGPLQS